MKELNNDVRPQLPTTSIAGWPDAEVLLLTALRCWLAGYETGDIACWELAWQGVSRNRSLADAKRIIAELGQFTRVFRQSLTCRFVYLPYCCGRITDEERLALQLVACAQQGELIRAGQLAHKLSNNDDHADLVRAASDLGGALKDAALTLLHPEILESSCNDSRALH
jgi:hypothetical protein